MEDLISDFVSRSRAENGPRSELKMRKEVDGAGFCIRAKGGKNAIAALGKALGDIDLSEHQP